MARWVLVAVATGLVACGSSAVVSGSPEAGTDAGSDAGIEAAAEDAGVDAAIDAGTDATNACVTTDGGAPLGCRFVDDSMICEKAACGRAFAYQCEEEGAPWGADDVGSCEASRFPTPGVPYTCCERKRCVRTPGPDGGLDKQCSGASKNHYSCPAGQRPQLGKVCFDFGDNNWCCDL